MAETKIYQSGQWYSSGPLSTQQISPSPLDVVKAAYDDGYAIVILLTNGNRCSHCVDFQDWFLSKYTLNQNYVYVKAFHDMTDKPHYLKVKWSNDKTTYTMLQDFGSTKDKKSNYMYYTINPQYSELVDYCQKNVSGYQHNGNTWPHLITLYKDSNGKAVTSYEYAPDLWVQSLQKSHTEYRDNYNCDEFKTICAQYFADYLSKKFAGYVIPKVQEEEELKKNYYDVKFMSETGAQIGDTQRIQHGKNATPPSAPIINTKTFSGWVPGYTNITCDTICYATYSNKEYENPRIVTMISEDTTKFAYNGK